MFALRKKTMRPRVAGLVFVCSLITAGCTGVATGTSDESPEPLREGAADLEAQRAELERQRALLAQARAQFEAEQQEAGTREAARVEMPADADRISIGPENAKPGECYARVLIPAVYQTTTERVETKKQSERIEIIPARYETVEEEVLVRPATTRTEVVPARYETVEERVEIKPATIRREIVPAVYETVEERVLVKPAGTRTVEVPAEYETVLEERLIAPARTEWRFESEIETGNSAGLSSASQTIDRFGSLKVLDTRIESTGELMCLVEVPAQYRTIEKQVLVRPATTRTVVDESRPAEYRTVTKTILVKPESVREIVIPAEYGTVEVTRLVEPETTREIVVPAEYRKVSVTRLVEPARERRVEIPAEYTVVTGSSQVSAERFDWRPVLCKVNMTRENVGALQRALTETGCCRCGPARNACKADGIMGPCTLDAAQCFAKSRKLPWGNNYVTLDVIAELGLEF